MLERLRRALITEAESSPTLLSDLAGLEEYISESYDSRSIIELTQNADDAGARRIAIVRDSHLLMVANDGRCFTEGDLEALCRSAASTKVRGQTIGYRGIGFKSVASFAETVHLITGDIRLTFSRTRTQATLPAVKRVPLVRVPHPLTDAEWSTFEHPACKLLEDGYRTIFAFTSARPERLDNELISLDPSVVLFLRSLEHVEVRSQQEFRRISCSRQTVSTSPRVVDAHLVDGDTQTRWRIFEGQDIALAFSLQDDCITRLDERESVVHAFLPTHEATGFGFKVQGDFSTDPSRTRVVFDGQTQKQMDASAELLLRLIETTVRGTSSAPAAGIELALAPSSDLKVATFQRKSFRTEFFATLQRMGATTLSGFRLRPHWLNAKDFEVLASHAGLDHLAPSLESVPGLVSMLKHLGATDANIDDLQLLLQEGLLSVVGSAETVSYLTQRWVTGQASIEAAIRSGWRLWPIAGRMLSLPAAGKSLEPLDQPFLDIINERGRRSDLRRLLSNLVSESAANRLMPEAQSGQTPNHSAAIAGVLGHSTSPLLPPTTVNLTLKRWRLAEQQVVSYLTASGWKASDVSRQNIGYDIEATTPTGEMVFIEVKSIDYPGQPFSMTSNEEAVAREKGKSYMLAIVRLSAEFLEIAFIPDPTSRINLTRQCRQWVWDCSDYDFSPVRVPLS